MTLNKTKIEEYIWEKFKATSQNVVNPNFKNFPSYLIRSENVELPSYVNENEKMENNIIVFLNGNTIIITRDESFWNKDNFNRNYVIRYISPLKNTSLSRIKRTIQDSLRK